MSPWLEVTLDGAKRRLPLTRGRTRLGGVGCELELEGARGDELHVWTAPPKVVLVGDATTPLLNGRAFDEAPLSPGDSIQWCGVVLVYGAEPVLEELPLDEEPARAGRTAAVTTAFDQDEARAWHRLQAGMLVDLGLANRKEAKRWQDAVVRGEFDADGCARDLLAASTVEPGDPRLVDRAGRLERDLLMSPLARGVRGASRRARGAARGGLAMLISQFIAITVYTLILAMILLLLRSQHEFSVDGFLDGVLDVFTPGS